MLTCPSCERRYSDDVRVCPYDGALTHEAARRTQDGSVIGRVLDGRWKVEELLQEGGMGSVYRGRQLSIKREVAIKLIRETVVREPVLVARFYRESQVLSDLQHPNIVTMYDFGQDEPSGDLFMVMELLRGKSLLEWLENAQVLLLRDIVQVAEQLFAALAEVHSKNVVHRDLKPENIFIERLSNGNVHLKLLDFGIAKVDSPHLTRLTAAGHLQGTPYYMAPEQIEGEPCSPQTDLYSAGVLLYEMLAGREPFPGDTLMAVLTQHLTKEPDPLDEVWALQEEVYTPLVELVHELMEKKPSSRPAYTLGVWERLKAMSSSMVAELPGGVTALDTADFPKVSAHDVTEARSAFLMTADHPNPLVDLPASKKESPAQERVGNEPLAVPTSPDAAPHQAGGGPSKTHLGETFHQWDQSADRALMSDEFEFRPGLSKRSKMIAIFVGAFCAIAAVAAFLFFDARDVDSSATTPFSPPLPPPIKPPPTAATPKGPPPPVETSKDPTPKPVPNSSKAVQKPRPKTPKATPRVNDREIQTILNDMRRP